MKRINSLRINEKKEIPILAFLWRWKVATTSAIYVRYYPVFKWAPFTAYQRMLKLKSKGLVEVKFSSSRNFPVWQLTRAGFLAIRDLLPLLSEEGFASEFPDHDLFVMAAHIGEWLPKGSVSDVIFFTEQELRRQSAETLFDWLPPTKVHRPDGYWYFPNTKPNSLLALEVEVNRKSFSDYMACGSFYNKYKAIDQVLWVIQSQSLAFKVVEAAHQNLADFRDIHNFVLFSTFREKGWQSKIFKGPSAGSTMHEFLNFQRLKQPESNPKANLKHAFVSQILDWRQCRFKSNTYETDAALSAW